MKLFTTLIIIFLFGSVIAQEGWNDVTPAGTYPGLLGVYALDSDNVWVVGDPMTPIMSGFFTI